MTVLQIFSRFEKFLLTKSRKAFYSASVNPDLRNVRPPATEESGDLDLDAFIARIKSAPPEKLAALVDLLRA